MVIFYGSKEQEDRADKFALDIMIPNNVWNKVLENYSEENIKKKSIEYRISIMFIVVRFAKLKLISYKSKLYNNYNLI